MRLIAVLFLALSAPLAMAGFSIKKIDQSTLEIHAQFEDMTPIYTEGVPVGSQGGLIFVGSPADFKVSVLARGQELMGLRETKLTEFMPCRCSGNTVKGLTQVAPDSLSAYELQSLGDFRGVALTKLTLRSSALKEGVVSRYESLTVRLSRVDQKEVARFNPQRIKLAPKLVIVTPANWLEASERLAQAVSATGIKVTVKTLEDFGPTFWDLKRSFKSLYEREQFGHVLLVGDEDHFPTELVQTSTDFQTPSDLQYYLMGDASDRIPDVMGARLAVTSADQIDRYREKFVAYQSARAHKHSIVVASDEGTNPTDVEYARAMAAPLQASFGHEISEVFQAHAHSGAEYLVEKIELGTDLLNYIGHGSGYSWPSVYGREFDLNDVAQTTSGAGHFVLIDVACQNGRFSSDGRLGVNFMNHQVSGVAAGTVAYYGGSVDISWHPPAVMAVAINQNMAQDPSATLGEYLLRGQLELIETYDDLESALENLTWYHLQGVPTLKPHF